MSIAIDFNNISHSYGAREVLHEVNLAFESEIISAIIGRSGSGKSTLLQMINGLIRPVSGRISLFGKPLDYTKIIDIRRRIGYSVQGTGLFPHLTVFENITLLARVSGMDEEAMTRRVDYLLNLVDLERSFKSKYPHQLSGGEQQRVGICRAMMLKPGIFLLDEAFGALDPLTRSELHEELLKLQKAEPVTIILVTHDLREALKLAEKIVILEKGRVRQVGTPQTIRLRPANDFVYNFVQRQLE